MEEWMRYYIINRYRLQKAKTVEGLNRLGFKQLKYPISVLHKYAGKRVMGLEETNRIMAERIKLGEPFMAGRFGANELRVMVYYLREQRNGLLRMPQSAMNALCSNAGFFPNDREKILEYARMMLEECREIDLCGIWRLFMEDYVLHRYAPAVSMTLLDYLEPWLIHWSEEKDVKPWTSALAGKKVLVIHPFSETIEKQYHNNRTKIFADVFQADDILPEFELRTIRAVQTINGTEGEKYGDWFKALDHMLGQCKSADFDIAIIGCGAYGFPLAAEIKKMGKTAVHLGGATQLLFGIKGGRWETMAGYRKYKDELFNEYWVRASEKERPVNYEKIEGGCYW